MLDRDIQYVFSVRDETETFPDFLGTKMRLRLLLWGDCGCRG